MTLDLEEVAKAIDLPLEGWAGQCHAVSLALLQAGVVQGRVARGWCPLVPGQHSWIVQGEDCYDPDAQIVDPTLWTYSEKVEGIWEGSAAEGLHLPHGLGSIWAYGRPPKPTEEPVPLDAEGLSQAARSFLELVGPLDRQGWMVLFGSPVGDWPAAEIIGQAYEDPALSLLIPIDIVGMLTDHNPGGLYKAQGES